MITLFLLGIGICSGADSSRTALKKVRIQLKWHHQFQFAGYYAAQSQGYYRNAGLDVTIVEGTPKEPPLETVLSGRADFGVTDTDVLLARLEGKPVVVCAAIFQHSPYIMLSLAEKGLTKPSDLIGKRVMVSTDQGEAELRAMILREGISQEKFQFLPHTWNLQDLIENRVDAISAYSTVEPSQLRQMGYTPSIIRFSDYGVDFYGDTLFTTEALIKADRALVRAFVSASLKGWDYAINHPEEMIERILQMPNVKEHGIHRTNLEIEAREMVPLIQADLVDLGHMNEGRWERIAHTFVETGIIKEVVNLKHFIFEPQPSPNLKPLLWGIAILGMIGGLIVLWTLQLRHQVEQRTREVKEGQYKLSAILDNTFQLQGLLDPDGKVLESNSTAIHFSGIQRSDVLGKFLWDTIWWAHATSEQEKLRLAIHQIQKGQDSIRFETQRPDKMGTLHMFDFSARAVRSDEGTLRFIMVEAYNITDRKRAENARRVSEANLLALLENSSGAIWSLDREMRYLTFNSRYQDQILVQGGQKVQIGQRVDEVESASHFARWQPHYQ